MSSLLSVVGESMSTKPKKDCVVALRLTDGQRADLAAAAECAGQKLAAYLRTLVISRSPAVREPSSTTKRLTLTFEKIGNDLNRTAHLVNSAHYRGVVNEFKFKQWANNLAASSALALSVQSSLGSDPNQDTDVERLIHSSELATSTELKTTPVSFRLYFDEHAVFLPLIQTAGVSASVFFRELVFTEAPVFISSPETKRRLIFIANKSSNNLTQLTYRADTAFMRGIISQELRDKWLHLLVSIESFFSIGITHAD